MKERDRKYDNEKYALTGKIVLRTALLLRVIEAEDVVFADDHTSARVNG